MKRVFFVLIVSSIIWSCERDECCADSEIELKGKFSYTILGCDNSANLELSCTAWIKIIDYVEALVLPFGDVAYYYSYNVSGDVLTLRPIPVSSLSFNYNFKIINASTLEDIDNGDIYTKE